MFLPSAIFKMNTHGGSFAKAQVDETFWKDIAVELTGSVRNLQATPYMKDCNGEMETGLYKFCQYVRHLSMSYIPAATCQTPE